MFTYSSETSIQGNMAVSAPEMNEEMVILDDSASYLLALEAGKPKHP